VKIHARSVPSSFPLVFLCESRIDSLVHQLDNLGFGISHFSLKGVGIDDSQCFVILTDCSIRSNWRTLPLPLAVICGAGIGMLAGLTGIGGGIFLAPILMLTGQFDTRESAGISAVFILVNSLAAIVGCVYRTTELPGELVYWAIAAVAGGMIGSELGVKRLGQVALRRLLALVLSFTGARLIARN
jgi:uncharacterized membrane protein YfcA